MVEMQGKWLKTTSYEQLERLKTQKKRDFSGETNYRGPNIPYSGSNNPKAGQWDGQKMSQKMVADYQRFDLVDGIGVRNALFVSGCPFHCKNCYNPSIFGFNTGFPYTPQLEQRIIDDLANPVIDGITFLGGEPMLATPILLPLAKKIREKYGDSKTIWSWTGYTWEELHRKGETPDKLELISLLDVLVDGRFIEDLKDPMLRFRGSSNQRIIDVKRTIKTNTIVLWNDNMQA